MGSLDSLDDDMSPTTPLVTPAAADVLPRPTSAAQAVSSSGEQEASWSDRSWTGWRSWWEPSSWSSGSWAGYAWQGYDDGSSRWSRSYATREATESGTAGDSGSRGDSAPVTSEAATASPAISDPWAAAAAAITAAAAAARDPARDRDSALRDGPDLPGLGRAAPGQDPVLPPRESPSGHQGGRDRAPGEGWHDGGWRWSPPAKGDFSDPPAWPGWQYRRHWTQAVRRWNKSTDVPLYRRAEKVLRSLGWELQADFDHLAESQLLEEAYLEHILSVIDSKAGVRDGDEKRKVYKAVLTETHRRKDESLAQYSLRRQRDFHRAAGYDMDLPPSLRAAMLREGAGLSDQNQQNLTALLGGRDTDPDHMAKALGMLDVRADKIIGFAIEDQTEEGPDSNLVNQAAEEVSAPEEEDLTDEEIIAELDSLDLNEDQICEVYAVLNQGHPRRRRSWKENRVLKAETRKERAPFVKNDTQPGKGTALKGPAGEKKVDRDRLKRISRCRKCGKRGHWAAECPDRAITGFVYAPDAQGSGAAFSFLTRETLRDLVASLPTSLSQIGDTALSFITLVGGEAILDIGATQDLIGITAFQALTRRLADVGLRPIRVEAQVAVPSGIGGKAPIDHVALIPVSPGGCVGVLQMVVLAADIPPLLSVGFLDFLGTIVNLPENKVRFENFGVEIPMHKLPSGHRTIPLISWSSSETCFPVPEQLQKRYGLSQDAFNLKSGPPSCYAKRGGPPVTSLSLKSECCDPDARACPTPPSTQSAWQQSLCQDKACGAPPGLQQQATFDNSSRATILARANVPLEHQAPVLPSRSTPNSSRVTSHGSLHDQADREMESDCDSCPHRSGEQPPDVLQAGAGRADQEGQAGTPTLCDGARECSRDLLASGHQNLEARQSMGVMAGVWPLRSSDCLCQQATSQGEEQGKGQAGRNRADRDNPERLHPRNLIDYASTKNETNAFDGKHQLEPDGSTRLLEHDAHVPAGHPDPERGSPGVGSWTKPDPDDDAGVQECQHHLHGSSESAGAATGTDDHGGGLRDRVGRSEPQRHRGPRTTTMSWPLLFTTSLLSMSTVLGWEQCSSELHSKVPIPAQVTPAWVLHEDAHLQDQDIRMWKPKETRWPSSVVPSGLAEAVRCTRGRYTPPGWKVFWCEHRDQDGVVYYAGPDKRWEVKSEDDMVAWLLPSRLSKVLQHMGPRAAVLTINQHGETDPLGSFWVFGEDSLVPTSFIADISDPEEVMRPGDLTKCEVNLKGLLRRGRDLKDPQRWDYMELISVSRLLETLQAQGLRIPSETNYFHEQSGWRVSKADHRRKCREAVARHKPQVLAIQLPAWKEGTNPILKQVALDFAGEIAQEQVRSGRHLHLEGANASLDAAPLLCALRDHGGLHVQGGLGPEGKMVQVSTFATDISQEEEPKERQESFAQVDHASTTNQTTFSLKDSESQARKLMQQQDFSFKACEQLLLQADFHGPRQVRACVQDNPAGTGCYLFGLFQHGGVWGITNRSKQRPQLTSYINKFLDFHGADPRRTSFSIAINARSKLHVDCHNEDGAYNSVISLGDHQRGDLWMDARCQPLGGTILRKRFVSSLAGNYSKGTWSKSRQS